MCTRGFLWRGTIWRLSYRQREALLAQLGLSSAPADSGEEIPLKACLPLHSQMDEEGDWIILISFSDSSCRYGESSNFYLRFPAYLS